MKLLGSTKIKITKDENGEYVPYLEITELVLIHCKNSRVFYIFVPNKLFSQLLDINKSPNKFLFLKTFDSEFSCIKVWFTDQNFDPLRIEDKINITLVIN